MLWTILVILLIIWLVGGGAPLAGLGNGFGGSGIHLIWVVIIILVALMLLGRG